jgi:hypothetical protein
MLLKGLLSYPVSGYQISGLLNHFFELRAEHIHTSIGVKVPTHYNVKPVALFAFDNAARSS